MSITDPSADAVQPQEGQGDGGTSDAPYAEYLSRIPEGVRGDVEPVFKEWDANVTQRFQDAAAYRKQWEPYEQAGVNQLPPDQVAYGLQLVQAMENPQVMQQWWNEYAQANNLQAQSAEPDVPAMDDFGFQDPAQLQSLIDQATGPLKQQLEQMQSHIEQQQQQQALSEANQFVEGQIQQLEQKHGKLDDNQREVLATFAGKFADSDPMNAIARGYEAMTKFINGIEQSALQAKVDAPAAAESGGVADVNPPQFKTIHDDGVKNQAIEFLRNNNRA